MNMDYSDAVVYLKWMYDCINDDWFGGELPDVTLTIMKNQGTWGHLSTQAVWILNSDKQHELNVAAGGLNREVVEIAATIIHESVHLWCLIHGIQDTSNRGVYHNMKFKEESEKHGLIINKHAKYGWTITQASSKLILWCEEQGFSKIEIYRQEPSGVSLTGDTPVNGSSVDMQTRKGSTRKYKCLSCGNSVRATKEVNLICGDCLLQMVK